MVEEALCRVKIQLDPTHVIVWFCTGFDLKFNAQEIRIVLIFSLKIYTRGATWIP